MKTPPSRIVWPLYPLSQEPIPEHVQRYPGAIAGEGLKVRLVFMHQKPFHVTTNATPAYCPTDAELNVIATKYAGMKLDGPEWIRIKSDLILAGEDAMQMERWPASVVISKLQPTRKTPRKTMSFGNAADETGINKGTINTAAHELEFGGKDGITDIPKFRKWVEDYSKSKKPIVRNQTTNAHIWWECPVCGTRVKDEHKRGSRCQVCQPKLGDPPPKLKKLP